MQFMEADVALTPEQKALVSEIIRQKLPAAQVQVFGSRATGKARPYSDLDLLFIQPARLAWEVRYELEDAFESSTLPFRVDLVDVETVSPQMLKRIRSEATTLPL